MESSLIPRFDADWAAYISTINDDLPEIFTVHKTPLRAAIHRTIDHTQLAPDATDAQIDALCAEARTYQFAAVCVRLAHVARAARDLHGSDVGVACVVGFPDGMAETDAKVAEAREAVRRGASELDMVLKYPLLERGAFTAVYEDVVAVRKAAPAPAVRLKVILETGRLDRERVVAGSVVACVAGADFIKTSTGFNGPGASVENVALMRAVAEMVGSGCKIKASGGVRSSEDCVSMLKAGADRIGTSSGVAIMKGLAGTEEAGSENTQDGY